MDRPMKRSLMSLIDVMGGVVDVSTTMNLGHSGDAIVSSCGLPRPTPVIRLGI